MRPQMVGAIVLCLAGSAEAQTTSGQPEQCALHKYITLTTDVSENGMLTVPVVVEGKPLRFRVDAFGQTTISPQTVDALHLQREPLSKDFSQVDKADVQALSLSGPGQRIDLTSLTIPIAPTPGADGTLGSSIFQAFDTEFDLANNTISLYAQDHCPDKVVYWAQSYADLPMMPVLNVGIAPPNSDKWKITIIPSQGLNGAFLGTLDGVNLPVSFNTTLQRARLSWEMAQRLFKIDEDSPGIEPATASKDFTVVHEMTFKKLIFSGGVEIDNLQTDLWTPESGSPKPAALELGLNEMRRLHIYVSTKEHKLYITSASIPAHP